MLNWFKKSALELDEYKTLLKRYTDIEARVLSLETSNEVFRNQVLRKVQIQTEKPKDLNRVSGGIISYGTTGQNRFGHQIIREEPAVKTK